MRFSGVLVTRLTDPPIASASMSAVRVFDTSIAARMSEGTSSSFTMRFPPSVPGTCTPSTVTFDKRGSVPRICTNFPSPSSRSSDTSGIRPAASAAL